MVYSLLSAWAHDLLRVNLVDAQAVGGVTCLGIFLGILMPPFGRIATQVLAAKGKTAGEGMGIIAKKAARAANYQSVTI